MEKEYRDWEIQKIGKKIQYQIDQLKKLNCNIDMRYSTIGIFDNEIEPERIGNLGNYIDHENQIVFSFNTAILPKKDSKNHQNN